MATKRSAAQSFLRRSLKLRHLRLLLALEDSGTITGAAGRLGVSQVAASKTLAEFEAGINTRLFERLRGGMQATEACLRLLETGRRIIGELKVLGEEFMLLDEGLQGRIRIGVQTQSSQPFLARTIVASKTFLSAYHDRVRSCQYARSGQRAGALGPAVRHRPA